MTVPEANAASRSSGESNSTQTPRGCHFKGPETFQIGFHVSDYTLKLRNRWKNSRDYIEDHTISGLSSKDFKQMLAEHPNKENETLMVSLFADDMTQWKYTDRLFGRPLTNIPIPLIKRQGMLECDPLDDRRSAASWTCPKFLMTTSSPI